MKRLLIVVTEDERSMVMDALQCYDCILDDRRHLALERQDRELERMLTGDQLKLDALRSRIRNAGKVDE